MNTYALIRADLHRVVPDKVGLKALLQGLRNPGFRYLFFARLKNGLKFRAFYPILWLIVRNYTYKFGFQIPVENLDGGLYLGHFGTIVISVNARIGKDCNIAHNVTIGTARGLHEGAPLIGDRVWIGTGAVIVGKIEVGDDVLIAPNSFVNFDVPSHSVVIGNPAKVHPKNNPTALYINNRAYS